MKEKYEKYYRRSKFFSRIRKLYFFPLFLLAKIIPKVNIVLFGSMNGYAVADNSKYLFTNTYKKNYFWITKNKTLLGKEILPNIYPVYAYCFKGIFLQFFAKTVYYTHSLDDFIPPLIMGANIICLFHGLPFKKVGAITSGLVRLASERSFLRKKLATLASWLMPYADYMYCRSVICPEEKFKKRYEMCWKCKPDILIEQFPRIKYAKQRPRERKIIYCPTYRKYRSINDVINKLGIISDSFGDWLREENIFLIIRPHPIDVAKIDRGILNDNIAIDTSLDIYESLTQYPILITDYSSLYYDAEQLGIKVFFLTDDIELYDVQEEGLFEDFKSFLIDSHKENINDFKSDFERIIKRTL